MKVQHLIAVVAVAATAAVLTVPGVAAGAGQGATCRVGQSCKHHGTIYRATGVKVTRSIGSGYMRETTSGRFVVITATLTNVKNRPSTIMAANLNLRVRSGASYSVSTKGIGVDNALWLTESLQPQLPVRVVLIFELPARAVAGAVLEINDMGTGDKARIRLGL
jgi:hypothetical protein